MPNPVKRINRAVWKFSAFLYRDLVFEMPKGAQVLSVGMQGEYICFWALVDTEALKEHRQFFMFGTGTFLPEDLPPFIGTVFDGPFVWHIFGEK